ncbi:MAG: 4Fe-4S dicluster domain-containing protein [Candidatus Kapabacteria bacterium]|nr:4Fe-4S dicluster domain-containing protein [Ignavibacteriota bacterium]MCW5885522.1 4Fe-4S dicluster domain-containing protein [Candidatus Kapabacteria bacterium]
MDFGIKNIIFIVIFIGAFAFFTKNALRLISYLKLGKPDNRFGEIGNRIRQTLIVAFAQTKILRDKQAGPIHAGIFWGFLILLFSAVNAIVAGLFGVYDFFSFLGPIYSVITILTDLFCFAIIIAIVFALWRRYGAKVKRLQVEAEKIEAAFILLMIFTIVTSLLFENATASVMYEAGWSVRPLAAAVGMMIPESAVIPIHEISFWIHILLIFAFMNYLPFSKHLHVLTSVPNVYFSNTGPVNKLDNIDFEDENIEKYGVSDVEDFKWKTLLDGYTCTHCGRCTSVCPANITGKVLDPRQIIIEIRERTMEKMPILAKYANGEANYTEDEQKILDKKFIGEYENIEALWQCTTCGACMQECPVNIEHVPAIVDMRRSLVMMESEFPALLQNTFGNLETNATPWAFPPSERADWADGADIKTAAELGEFDILFWVGCAGSFDDRAKKVSLAFSKLMQIADINFAILGTEEQCNGDVARRTGNEYLADMMVKANIETIGQYKFNKIVATCPHCFNTLKNEYPTFGANYEVVHHSQFIMDLIKQGKLSPSAHSDAINDFTYHDSCYMGRYNNVYDEPRDTLLSVPGLKIRETVRSKDRGLCCGAGGGQMFLEEDQGKRVNIERTEELLETGAKNIAVNCPFCMTMITDGVKAKEIEDVKVKDISEVILENIESK